ncbi:SAM-dependent methyltransferase [Streptomyces sp. 4N509B]|uniref:SAM-dependent methyltransferase n=1 Tax=Streptomyces sp. 4N509B TaxID=3457413 RepID=UPI003FD2CE67
MVTLHGRAREIDSTVSHVARIWNYWLGGRDNYAVDREVGDLILDVLPEVATLARTSRDFLARSVRFMAREAGIRQFLDIGTGLPTAENTHEIAQRVAPDARVVYVDNDPLVLSYARALLTGTPEGVTDYIDADLRDPETILREAARVIDFDQPVGLVLMGVMEFILDDDEANAIIGRLLDALPSGSYLALHSATNIVHGEVSDKIAQLWNELGSSPLVLRSPEVITGFFSSLELLDPGVVTVTHWRPEPDPLSSTAEPLAAVDCLGGVGRKR